MTNEAHDTGSQVTKDSTDSQRTEVNWKRHFIMLGFALVGLLILYFIGTSVMPRWWAQQVGNWVDGKLGRGAWFGVTMGFVFTLIPILLLRVAAGRHSWGAAGFWIAAAVLTALPNLLTLGIVMGNGDGARAGRRVMDVDAPYFRGACAIGAIIAVVVGLALIGWQFSSARNRRKLHERDHNN